MSGKIRIHKRTQAEINSYQEGYNAGVQMCLNVISENYARYREMVRSVVVAVTMESEQRQCDEVFDTADMRGEE